MPLFSSSSIPNNIRDIILSEEKLGKKIFYKYIDDEIQYFSHHINEDCLNANLLYNLRSLNTNLPFNVRLSTKDELIISDSCIDSSNSHYIPKPTPKPSPKPTHPPYPCDPDKTLRCKKGCDTLHGFECDFSKLNEVCWWGDPRGGECEITTPTLTCARGDVMLPEDDHVNTGICKQNIPRPPPSPTPCVCPGPKCVKCGRNGCECRKKDETCWRHDGYAYGGLCCMMNEGYDTQFFCQKLDGEWLDYNDNTSIGVCRPYPLTPGYLPIGATCQVENDKCDKFQRLSCCKGRCIITGTMAPGSCG